MILWNWIRNRSPRERVIEKDPEGLADLLLPRISVESGIILQDDDSLIAAWEYAGPDLASSAADQICANVQKMSNAMRLGSGWMVHADLIRSEDRTYAPQSGDFANPVAQIVDEQRRNQFTAPEAQYKTQFYLALSYRPVRGTQTMSWLMSGGESWSDSAARVLKQFRNGIAAFENIFGSILTIKRLGINEDGTDSLLRYLNLCVSGIDHPLIAPEVPIDLNCLIGNQDLYVSDAEDGMPRIGDKRIRVIAIEGFPKETRPGILDELNYIRAGYRWSTRVILLDPMDALAAMEEHWKKWESAAVPVSSYWIKSEANKSKLNLDAVDMASEVRRAMALASSQDVYFASFTSNIVVYEENREKANATARKIQTSLQNKGFGCRIESVNALEGFLGTMPGDGMANVRRVDLHTLNVADMLPLTSVWTGDKQNPSPLMHHASCLMQAVTTGNNAFHFNFHVRDLGHTTITGRSGSGKSTLIALAMMQWLRYKDPVSGMRSQVIALDWDYSLELTTKALGGVHKDIGSGDVAFSPLKNLDTDEDKAWAEGFLSELCELNRLALNAAQRNEITRAVIAMAAKPRGRDLSVCAGKIQDAAVREALEYYTLAGGAGELFDSTSDTLDTFTDSTRVITFETRSLLDAKEDRRSIPALMYLFRRIEKRLTGAPTLIILDEAWAYLGHPMFAKKISEWLRTVRGKNAAVIIATQDIGSMTESGIVETIFNNVATRIFLPNAYARDEDAAAFYRRAGLSKTEIDLVAQGTAKADYYIKTEHGSRNINFRINKIALAFSEPLREPKKRAAARAFIQRHGDRWAAEWLRQYGKTADERKVLGQWADRLQSVHEGSEDNSKREDMGLCALSA